MGWWARLFGGGYEALWLAERAAAEAADHQLEGHLDPDFCEVLHLGYWLPGDRWGRITVHRCGPARLRRELAAKGFAPNASQGIWGDVFGGQVEVYVLWGVAPSGRYAGSQRGAGHEVMAHAIDQVAAIWVAHHAGGGEVEMKAAAAKHRDDADHSGEGL